MVRRNEVNISSSLRARVLLRSVGWSVWGLLEVGKIGEWKRDRLTRSVLRIELAVLMEGRIYDDRDRDDKRLFVRKISCREERAHHYCSGALFSST